MKKYLLIAGLSFQVLAEYRFNFLMRMVINSIWYSVVLLFWWSMASSGMDIRPYTPQTLGIYYFLIAVISTFVGFPATVVSQEIREGKIGSRVVKPVNYLLLHYFTTIPDKVVMLVIIGSVMVILRGTGLIVINLSIFSLITFILALVLASIGNFLVYFLVGVTAFWLRYTHGVSALVSVTSNIISGSMIPLELLPGGILLFSQIFPFRYFHFFPIQIFLGNVGLPEMVKGFGVEIFWIVFLILLYKLVWHYGMKQLEVIGT